MATSYAAWAKFDVEKELERVDERIEQEQQQKAQLKQILRKQSVEDSISQTAEQSAEVVAAHAAVAALKAKSKRRTRASQPSANKSRESNPDNDAADVPVKEHVAAQLKEQSALLKSKHELLQQILINRREGDAILLQKQPVNDAASMYNDALRNYQTALTALRALERLVPQLRQVDTPQQDEVQQPASTTTNASSCCDHSNHKCCQSDASDCCDHHHHDHQGDKKETKTKPNEAPVLPKPNDLDGILKMFVIDIFLGIGRCEFGRKQFGAASEAFKYVLVKDDNHIEAWKQRGRAFHAMGAPLLAMLHYQRVTALDPNNADAKKELETIKESLMSQDDQVKGEIEDLLSERMGGAALDLSDLHLVRSLLEEAKLVMIEGFHQYAIRKYEFVLSVLNEWNTTNERTILTSLRLSCHVNIASAYYEMQRHLPSAVDHLQQAIAIDPMHVVARFRLAQVYRSLYQFEKAIAQLQMLQSPTAATKLSTKQSQVLQTKATTELDRCMYERSLYDLSFLKQQYEISRNT